MEAIYYVMCWACHRRCRHCYDARYRPYVRAELREVVEEAVRNSPRIIDNLPDAVAYLDPTKPLPGGGYAERAGRVALSGGELLIDPVREAVLYPGLKRLRARYPAATRVKLAVQTTGDLLTERILDELLEHGADVVNVSGMDDFHVGLEGDKRRPLVERLVRMFESRGLRDVAERVPPGANAGAARYMFFGATEDQWIGAIWPRGRAWANGLSRAGITDNFCARQSGGMNFLDRRYAGSEVAVDPAGNVYPCCLKTRAPLGSLLEERLTDILDSLAGHPAFEAINAGRPDRMGLTYGWSVDDFLAASVTTTPEGRDYRNLCIGCDRFHERVLGPVIAELRERRLAARRSDAFGAQRAAE